MPDIHFAMVDSGAMVGCIHEVMLTLYPNLKEYFVAAPDRILGVGNTVCNVVGDLHKVPICLGVKQQPGCLFFINLKVI